MKLTVDKELKALLPPLTKEQRAILKTQLQEEGCHDRIKVWAEKQVIVDGHNRYEVCGELDIPFDIEELSFANRAEVIEWMIKQQLGRRNLTSAQESAYRGRLYNERKKSAGAPQGNRNAASEKQCGQPDLIVSTAAEVAAETGVSDKTVRRDGRWEESFSSLPTKSRDAILAGEVKKPTQADLDRLAQYDAPSQRQLVDSVKSGKFPTVKLALDDEELPKPKKQPPKQFPRSYWLRQYEQSVGPLVRLVDKIAAEVGESHSKPHKDVQQRLNDVTKEMAAWMR